MAARFEILSASRATPERQSTSVPNTSKNSALTGSVMEGAYSEAEC